MSDLPRELPVPKFQLGEMVEFEISGIIEGRRVCNNMRARIFNIYYTNQRDAGLDIMYGMTLTYPSRYHSGPKFEWERCEDQLTKINQPKTPIMCKINEAPVLENTTPIFQVPVEKKTKDKQSFIKLLFGGK